MYLYKISYSVALGAAGQLIFTVESDERRTWGSETISKVPVYSVVNTFEITFLENHTLINLSKMFKFIYLQSWIL